MKVTNTEQFIVKSTIKHNRVYTYNNTVYIKSNQKVIVTCSIHGDFLTTPNNHLMGYGCKPCSIIRRGNLHNKTKQHFIEKATKIHGNLFDYSKVIYTKTFNKIEIICLTHGSFWQTPKDHISRKAGCPTCAKETNLTRMQLRIKSVEKFISLSNKKHQHKYNYSLVTTSGPTHEFVNIICKTHGIFSQQRYTHLQGVGCPKCNTSKGEREICKWLDETAVSYIHEAKFNDCINPTTQYHLLFDFFIPQLNVLVEFDGKQHFIPINFFACMDKKHAIHVHEETKQRDNIKNQYALTHNIQLFRIPFTMIKEIKHIILAIVDGSATTKFPQLIVTK